MTLDVRVNRHMGLFPGEVARVTRRGPSRLPLLAAGFALGVLATLIAVAAPIYLWIAAARTGG